MTTAMLIATKMAFARLKSSVLVTLLQVKDSNNSVLIVSIIGGIVALLLMGQAVVSATLARNRLEKSAFSAKIARVTKAAKSITSCEFSVCFCKYNAFEANGKLISHEQALVTLAPACYMYYPCTMHGLQQHL